MLKRLHALLICLATIISTGSLFAQDASKTSEPESFQVRNKKYGDLLRPQDANGADGTRIVLYSAQPWKCMTWKFHPSSESVFNLQNHFTSKTFSAENKTDKTQAVTQTPFSKDAAGRPAWRFTKLADGTYKIEDVKSGKALSAQKSNHGASVVIEPWQDTDEQKWELIKIDPKQLTM